MLTTTDTLLTQGQTRLNPGKGSATFILSLPEASSPPFPVCARERSATLNGCDVKVVAARLEPLKEVECY